MLSIREQVRGLRLVRAGLSSCPFEGQCKHCDELFPKRLVIWEKKRRWISCSHIADCPCGILSEAYIKRVSRKFVKDNNGILVE